MADSFQIVVDINHKNIDKQIKQIQKKLGNVKAKIDTKGIVKTNNSLVELGRNALDITKKFAQWTIISTLIFGVARSFSEMVKNVIAVDTALRNISITTGLTNEELKNIETNSYSVANSLGSTSQKVLEAVQIFSNLSESIESVNQKIDSVIQLANLSGGSIKNVSNSIAGLIYQFDLTSSSASHLADAMVAVASSTAVNFSQSIQTMTKSVSIAGRVMSDAGFSSEQFLATVATLEEQSRLSGSAIASGLVTVASRLKKNLDDSNGSVSDLEVALAGVGVKLRDTNGEFRNSFDVLEDLSHKYGDLNSRQQENITFLLAGTRQRKVANTLLKSFEKITERTTIALDSQNSAMKANDIFLESIEGKLNRFQNAFQELSNELIQSEGIKEIIDTGTSFINLLTRIDKSVGLLGSSLTVLIPIILALNAELIILKTQGLIGILQEIPVAISLLRAYKLEALSAIFVTSTLTATLVLASVAFAAVSVALIAYKVHADNAKKKAEELKIAQEEVNRVMNEGTSSDIADQVSDLEYLIDKYNDLKSARDKLSEEAFKEGSDEFLYTGTTDEIDKIDKKMKELENDFAVFNTTAEDSSVKLAEMKEKIGDVGLEEFKNEATEAAESVDLYNKALSELNEQGSVNTRTMLDLISLNSDLAKEFLTDIEIVEEYRIKFKNMSDKQKILQRQITENAILETKARIEAYRNELLAMEYNLKTMQVLTDEDEMNYMQASQNINAKTALINSQIEKLDDLYDQQKALEDLETGSSKRKKKENVYISDLVTRYFELEQAIKNLNDEIERNAIAIEDAQGDKRNNLLQKQIDLTEALKNKTAELNKEKRKELNENVTGLKQLGFDAGISDSGRAYITNIAKLGKMSGDSAKKAEELIKSVENLNDEIAKGVTDLENYTEKQEEYAKAIGQSVIKPIENHIKKLEEEKEATLAGLQAELDSLDKTIDSHKNKNKHLEDEIKLKREIEELDKLRAKRENILNEKNVRRFQDGKFQFVADDRELRKVDEQIGKQEQVVGDLKRKQRQEAEMLELNQKKIRLQEEKEAEEQQYNDRITQLENFLDGVNYYIQNGGEITQGLYQNIYTSLSQMQSNFFDDSINSLVKYVDKYNNAISGLNSGSNMGSISVGSNNISSNINSIASVPRTTANTSAVNSQSMNNNNDNSKSITIKVDKVISNDGRKFISHMQGLAKTGGVS